MPEATTAASERPHLLGCHSCGLVQSMAMLAPGDVAVCRRCRAPLTEAPRDPVLPVLCWTITALLLCLPAFFYPLFIVSAVGIMQASNGPQMVQALIGDHYTPLAAAVAAFVLAVPVLWLGALAVVLVHLLRAERRPWLGRLFRLVVTLDMWAMPEVFLLGGLVAYTRLEKVTLTTIGWGGWSYMTLAFTVMLVRATFDRHHLWEQIAPAHNYLPHDIAHEVAILCPVCSVVLPGDAEDKPCPRCGATVCRRKPNAILITTALVLSAFVLYIPANLLPVLSIVRFGREQDSTILGGALELIESGPVAAGADRLHGQHCRACLQAVRPLLVPALDSPRQHRSSGGTKPALPDYRSGRPLVECRCVHGGAARCAGAFRHSYHDQADARCARLCQRGYSDYGCLQCLRFPPDVGCGRKKEYVMPAELPHATIRKPGFNFIWLVPVAALAVVLWLGWHNFSSRGPTITITFSQAGSLEAGRTKIKLKEVEVGTVTGIALNKDLSQVIVTAQMDKSVSDFLADGAKFWVARPRFSAAGITGLDTLVSGAYIVMQPGQGDSQSAFKGLDEPPMDQPDSAGHRYTVHTSRLGALSQGSTVYYRGLDVGAVEGYKLNEKGDDIAVYVFVRAPFDHLVSKETRFWNASSVQISPSANGDRDKNRSRESTADRRYRLRDAAGPAGPGACPRRY